MNSIQVFNNMEFGAVRTINIENEPWFVAKDVAAALGYVRTNNMRKLLDSCEYKEIDPQNAQFTGLLQNGATEPKPNIRRMLIINESGLYSAIFSSTLENAKRFKHWVTDEVLPAIRKTGSYKVSNLESVNNSVAILTDLMSKVGCSEEIKLLTAKKLYEAAGFTIPCEVIADKPYYDTLYIAKKLGILVKSSGKPAYKAVNEIIRRIGVTEDEYVIMPEYVKGWGGYVRKYSESVITKIGEWLKENAYPNRVEYIQTNGEIKTYHLIYAH